MQLLYGCEVGCNVTLSSCNFLGPATVLRDPQHHAHSDTPGLEKYHVSYYDELGSRYHGGLSEEKYLNHIGVPSESHVRALI